MAYFGRTKHERNDIIKAVQSILSDPSAKIQHVMGRRDPVRGTEYTVDTVTRQHRKRLHLLRGFEPISVDVYNQNHFANPKYSEVNILMPLKGRLETFKQFVQRLRNVRKQGARATLHVMLHLDMTSDQAATPEEQSAELEKICAEFQVPCR